MVRNLGLFVGKIHAVTYHSKVKSNESKLRFRKSRDALQ